MQVTIEKIIYPGRSLARYDNKIVLTDEGIPGETVEAIPVSEKRNYFEARTASVLAPSPHRVPPRCDHYKICSPYQYMDYALQADIKKEQIKEIFSHDLKIPIPDIPFRPSPNIWNYRNKIDLHILWDGDIPYFAYNMPGSARQFIKIKECFLASERANHLLKQTLKMIADNKLRSIKDVILKESASHQRSLLVASCDNVKNVKNLSARLEPLIKQSALNGIVCVDKNASSQRVILGDNFIEETIREKAFHIGPLSFFQVNVPMLEQLIQDMESSLRLKGDETVADLYCGVGTFGIMLADRVSKVIGVDSEKENIYFLNRNIQLNKAHNFSILQGDCEKWVSHTINTPLDILIVDPPRKGLGEAFCRDILKKRVRGLVYISCNPSTLARDLKVLFSAYRLKDLYAYDFFPQTPHIETLSILELK